MKRSKYSLSHYKMFTADMGKLIPLTWYDVLPGDYIQHSSAALVRMSPLVAPVMHPVKVRIHHFFCPIRDLWESFEDFITGGDDGTDSTTPPYKTFSDTSGGESELPDYLGVAPYNYAGDAGAISVSAIPFRAYAWIFNEYFRDQDLVTELTVNTADGDGATEDTTTPEVLQNVSWEKDYFTTCRATETKGDAVTISLAGTAPIERISNAAAWKAYEAGSDVLPGTSGLQLGTDSLTEISAGAQDVSFDPMSGIRTNLASATGVDINDLRLSLAIQRFQERRNIHGSRYVEYLRSLGLRIRSDLDRPVYLGGGRQVVQFSEVLQTGQDYDANSKVGQMAGHGIAALRTNRWRKYFEEHGIVMSLMSVVPKNIYATGLHRSWSRDTKEHHWQKELETIGEQAVLNKEVDARHDTPAGTFGYQRRYDEYRWHPSGIAGEFRSTNNSWHLARIFGSDPALNSTFINCSPSKRIFADQSNDSLYVMCNHSIQARRLVNRFARPLTM